MSFPEALVFSSGVCIGMGVVLFAVLLTVIYLEETR